MNSRERRLVAVLGVFAVIGVIAAGYALIYSPIEELNAEADKVETEISVKQAVLDKLIKDQKRADAAKKRSLPADPDAARVEYIAMMQRLASHAQVQPGSFRIIQRDSVDSKNVPALDPKTKKTAYTKLGFEVRLSQVDITRLTAFLESFYRLNLLHQITKLEILRKDQNGPTVRGRTSGSSERADRADLEVTIQIEAIILDGAENRKTLLPIPLGIAAVGGEAGYFAVLNSPEAGRGISPMQIANVLASANPVRQYAVLKAKDYFHGPLPPPPKTEPIEVVQEAPPKPKEDISPYIKLTGITRRTDGTIQADIRDQANNQDYQIDLKPRGERYEVKVQKFYYIKDRQKRLDFWPELVIKEETASTNRTFKVIGTLDDGLVLTEATTHALDKPDGERHRTGQSKSTHKLPPAAPSTVVVGGPGFAIGPTGEKVYVWRVGQTLKSLTEVTAKDAAEALRRATPTSAAVSADPSPPIPVSKAD